MEFTITCPIDGPIDVSLEDIETVVLRESERADITFVCPHCGTEITVAAVIPSFLVAAMEALAEDPESPAGSDFIAPVDRDFAFPEEVADADDSDLVASDPRFEAYCEYFRRQLSHVDCVEDALHEIDSKG